MKCAVCGTEFEGKFCPNCGESADGQKTCPKCGAQLSKSVKFCTECGYAFYPTPSPTLKPTFTDSVSSGRSSTAWIIYRIVECLPQVLMALFTVLAFAFFATPVWKVTNPFLFGNDVRTVYEILSLQEEPSLRDPAIAYLVFACLEIPFAIAAIVTAAQGTRSMFCTVSDFLFYTVHILISAFMMSAISKLDEGMGVLAAGAAPILMMVFSILFAVFSNAALIASACMKDSVAVRESKKSYKTKKGSRKEAYYKTHSEPIFPTDTTPQRLAEYRRKKYCYDHAKESVSDSRLWFYSHRTALIVLTCFLIVAIVLISTIVPMVSNRFRIGIARKIELGATRDEVVEVLGEPYESSQEATWHWYDKHLMSYVKTSENIAKQQEEALNKGDFSKAEKLQTQYEELLSQIAQKRFSCIEVTFQNGKATSVFLDKSFGFEEEERTITIDTLQYTGEEKEIKLYYYIDAQNKDVYLDNGLSALKPYFTYTFQFSDGSWYRSQMSQAAQLSIETETGAIVWKDRFGEHSKTAAENLQSTHDLRLTKTRIGAILQSGSWIANGSEMEKAGFTEFEIPDGVTTIGYDAFSGCSFLTSITIPDSVTAIQSNAFRGCTALERVNITDLSAWCKIDFASGYANPLGYAQHLYVKGEEVTALTIPNGITLIKPYAFYNWGSLKSITIGERVISIGDYAFCGCGGLEGIEISDSVTSIGKSAFEDCTALENVSIGKRVTVLGENVFKNCPIKEATTPAAVISSIPKSTLIKINITSGTIKERAFSGFTSLTSVTLPNDMTEIGSYAFADCTSLTGVTLPNGITEIGSYAFSNCTSLTSITIPDAVSSIKSYAFSGCTSLTQVNSSDLSAWCKIDFEDASANPLYNAKYLYLHDNLARALTLITEIKPYSFCGGIFANITIGDQVTSIGNGAFLGCSIQEATIPASAISSIPNTSLTKITITSGAIGQRAFSNFYSLTSVTIGDKVTSIRSDAFSDCPIRNATIPASAISCIPKSNLTAVTITNGKIGQAEFLDCTSLTSVTIGDDVNSIGNNAFKGCTALTSLTIGDGVSSIGNDAFKDCTALERAYITSLAMWCQINFGNSDANPLCYTKQWYVQHIKMTSLTIPVGVTAIKNYAFCNCDSITNVTFGNGITAIGDSAFFGCGGLTGEMKIPDGVTSIGSNAFDGCTSLTGVTIGKDVAEIHKDAFSGCASLARVDITNLSTWCKINFENITANPLYYAKQLYLSRNKLTTLTIPDGITQINNYAFYNCASLINVTIGNKVTSIGERTFENCPSIISVMIGDMVTSIGQCAFEKCYELSNVTIGNKVTSIGESAFYECTALTKIEYKGTVTQWKNIKTGSNWSFRTGDYIITCTNGKISKNGTVTMK